MRGDKAEREVKRLDRWMALSMQVPRDLRFPSDAVALLFDRFDLRRRIARLCLPVLLLGIAAMWMADFGPYSPACNCNAWIDNKAPNLVFHLSTRHDVASAVGAVLVLGTLVLWGYLVQRADGRLARTLLRRTSSSARHTVFDVLRPAGTAFAITMIAFDVVATVLLFHERGGMASWVFVTTFCMCLTLSALAVLMATNRATIAVDPITLALDERLRSSQALFALTPLIGVAYLYSDLSHVGNATGILQQAPNYILVVYAFARIQRPWAAPQPPAPVAPVPMNTVNA
jgi:hypothetical protein